MLIAPLQSTAADAAVSNFLDAAAALERRLHDTEARAHTLQQDLQRLQHRYGHAREWIVAIRRSHRSRSHASTNRVIRAALASVTADVSTVLPSSRPLFQKGSAHAQFS